MVEDILRQAKALISEPTRLTRGAYARDHNAQPVAPNSPDAVCWCAIGAIYKVVSCDITDSSDRIGHALVRLSHNRRIGVIETNDRGTHQEVMDMYDRAIASSDV